MSLIIYTRYIRENALFLQQCALKEFTTPERVNIYLKEQLYIQKYLDYLSFNYSNVMDFHESDFYKNVMIYHNQIFNINKDNQYFHNPSSITDTQRNIRTLIDNVYYDIYLKIKKG